MASQHAKEEEDLPSWYANLWAPRVDLIGDIAGKEPFLIHGESLMRHCLEESPPDFQGRQIELDTEASPHTNSTKYSSTRRQPPANSL
jgi:hypothetical protein